MIWRQRFLVNAFFAFIFFVSCTYNDLPNSTCSTSDLIIEAVGTNPANCSVLGSVQITSSGGDAPYAYALNGGEFVSNNVFNNVVAGSHTARVQDGNGCIVEVEVILENPSSELIIDNIEVVGSGCETSEGIITVTASGETGITYSMDNSDFSNTTGIFTDLALGTYSVYVKGGDGCVTSSNNIKVTTGVSFETDIKPILELNCIKSGCHNGDNGAERNWSVFANVKAKAQRIKQFTADGTMPLDNPDGLPQVERDLIACWVDDGALDN